MNFSIFHFVSRGSWRGGRRWFRVTRLDSTYFFSTLYYCDVYPAKLYFSQFNEHFTILSRAPREWSSLKINEILNFLQQADLARLSTSSMSSFVSRSRCNFLFHHPFYHTHNCDGLHASTVPPCRWWWWCVVKSHNFAAAASHLFAVVVCDIENFSFHSRSLGRGWHEIFEEEKKKLK